MVALFPLLGLWLGWVAAIKWLQWKRFGNLELQMDPFPTSPGGDASGTIELLIPYRAGKTVDVTLSCIKVRISAGTDHHAQSRGKESHQDHINRVTAHSYISDGYAIHE